MVTNTFGFEKNEKQRYKKKENEKILSSKITLNR